MLGFLANKREVKELEYLIKREMEEILQDLNDGRIDRGVKQMMEERYQLLFNFFRRFASETECGKYFRNKRYHKKGHEQKIRNT